MIIPNDDRYLTAEMTRRFPKVTIRQMSPSGTKDPITWFMIFILMSTMRKMIMMTNMMTNMMMIMMMINRIMVMIISGAK